MTFHEFQDFVAANIDWFHGRFPETDSSLQRVERALGVELPHSLKWLLKEHGYWHGTGVSDLEGTVKDTLDARRALALPSEFVVLENLQDGGVVLIDTGEVTSSRESPLYWIAPEDLGDPPRLEGNTRYDSYGEYVKDRLPSMQDFIEPRYVRYDPADSPKDEATANKRKKRGHGLMNKPECPEWHSISDKCLCFLGLRRRS